MELIKTKQIGECTKYYIFGIGVYKKKGPFYALSKSFAANTDFNCTRWDQATAHLTDRLVRPSGLRKSQPQDDRIAFLATQFYDMGGHTEWVLGLMAALSPHYQIKTFLTNYSATYQHAKNKMKDMEKYSEIAGLIHPHGNTGKNLKQLLEQINTFAPKVLFVFMHMDDFQANALLYLIRRYTDIKIIYCNHASHFPFLGTTFADAVTCSSPAILYTNVRYRQLQKNILLNLTEYTDTVSDISPQEKEDLRRHLGIKQNAFFTLSGASAYKFFDKSGSPYFQMIKRLLEQEKNLFHVVITRLDPHQQQVVSDLFQHSCAKNRLKIIPFTPDYSKIFQACDVFIDSFPVSSALTYLTLMKHKKACVIKINNQNALWSFHEYFPPNYPYMSESVSDLERYITQLLHHPDKTLQIGQDLYQHYMHNFSTEVIKNQCENIIKHADRLDQLFLQLPATAHYNIRTHE